MTFSGSERSGKPEGSGRSSGRAETGMSEGDPHAWRIRRLRDGLACDCSDEGGSERVPEHDEGDEDAAGKRQLCKKPDREPHEQGFLQAAPGRCVVRAGDTPGLAGADRREIPPCWVCGKNSMRDGRTLCNRAASCHNRSGCHRIVLLDPDMCSMWDSGARRLRGMLRQKRARRARPVTGSRFRSIIRGGQDGFLLPIEKHLPWIVVEATFGPQGVRVR